MPNKRPGKIVLSIESSAESRLMYDQCFSISSQKYKQVEALVSRFSLENAQSQAKDVEPSQVPVKTCKVWIKIMPVVARLSMGIVRNVTVRKAEKTVVVPRHQKLVVPSSS